MQRFNMTGCRVTRWTLLLLFALTSWPRDIMATDSTCSLPSPSPGDPQRPVVSGQLTVHVEATLVEHNATMEIIDYYDNVNKRGRLRERISNKTTDYYYDYSRNQLLVVNPETYECHVQRLSSGSEGLTLGSNGVFSPAASLRMNTQSGTQEVYIGKGTVRGIAVNQWASCLGSAHSNTTGTITWSFVDNFAWDTSSSVVNTPVLLHVTGRMYSSEQSYQTFEHIYEFVHFIDNIPPESTRVFETPRGVVCPGRINAKPLPTLSTTMAFTTETIVPQTHDISFSQETYDAGARIVVHKYRGSSAFSAQYGQSPLSVVTDFNTGNRYVLDQERGNCSIEHIPATPNVTRVLDLVTLRLQTATDIMNQYGNFTYQGQRTIRNMPCDVWITEKHTKDIMGDTLNTTIEWAFISESWTYQNSGKMSAGGVPIQIITTLNNFGSRHQETTNVYDHVSGVSDTLDGIQLDSCFIGLPRNHAVFSMARIYSTLLESFRLQFRYAVRHSVATAIGVSPLRVANVQFVVTQSSLDVSLDILSVAPRGGQVLPPKGERSLNDATQALRHAVMTGRLVIRLNVTSSLPPALMAADPTSLHVDKFNQPVVVTGKAVQPFPNPTGRPHSPNHFPIPTPRPHSSNHVPVPGTPTPKPDRDAVCSQYGADTATHYSAGVMVGSALSLGVVGAVLGGVTHRIIIILQVPR